MEWLVGVCAEDRERARNISSAFVTQQPSPFATEPRTCTSAIILVRLACSSRGGPSYLLDLRHVAVGYME